MKYLATAFAITILLSPIFIMGCGNNESGTVGGKNYPPEIDQIQAYGTVIKQGASTPFKVSAKDWDGDPLEYTWEATAGQFDQTTGESVVWTAPDTPGDVKVTVSVADGKNDPVPGTVSITVQPDKGLESDIIGTWSLVSIDNTALSDYQDKITLITADGTDFVVNVKYSSQEYTYNLDGTHTESLEFEYIIPQSSGLPYASNIVDCKGNITGTYSLSGSKLTTKLNVDEITIETTYKSQYTDKKKTLLDGYITNLEDAMKKLKGSVEPVDINIANDKMEWANNLSWERAITSVKFD